ncbi:integrase core domain-containing protein [Patescibacteria group bacterium]|nr:integrase core domain-containing protein [Patescibacteria group bacterium]
MNQYGMVLPGAGYLASLARRTNISKEAKKRLRWFDYYHKTNNARLTCRHFGISPQTFYRWKKRFAADDLTSLESKSSRPHQVRQPETPATVVQAIKGLREQYPCWGKDKLIILLQNRGINVSASTVGRTINRLKARGLLKEPVNETLVKLARKRKWKPRYAVRKPKDYSVKAPGDLVQLDTLVIKLLPDLVRYQFTARDIISKRDALKVYSRQTSFCAVLFLDYLERSLPFKIKALQIDGGSEWRKEFEAECQKRNILLFVLPPRSPKLNGCVERANRTHREEFYQTKEIALSLNEHNQQLARWEHTYNYIRPHQALDYLTPDEYYQQYLKKGGDVSLR